MIICADDYGLSPSVNEGIIELVEKKKISAVSCMVVEPNVVKAMKQIQRFQKKIDLGLHVVLTNGVPISTLRNNSGLVKNGKFLSFNQLAINAYRKNIDKDSIYTEVLSQLNLFKSIAGFFPDFIDGHQHVHQLPVIRSIIVKIAQETIQIKRELYVRVARVPRIWLLKMKFCSSLSGIFGNFLISLPGQLLARELNIVNIFQNRFLLGFYDYEGGQKFENVFFQYLKLNPNKKDVFFCHPGYVDETLKKRDSVVNSRIDTLNFLCSPECEDLMFKQGVGVNMFFEKVGIK